MREPRLNSDLLDRLNEASVRKRHYPFETVHIDWQEPITDDWLYCPESGVPFFSMPEYARFTASERVFLSRCRSASMAEAGIQLEQILIEGLTRLVRCYDPRSPLYRFMMHELGEETQHVLMFSAWLKKLNLPTPQLDPQLRVALPILGLLASRQPVLFFMVVLTGELTTDVIQADAIRDERLHPTLRQLVRLHHVEELRHISFGKEFVRQEYQALPRAERKLMRSLAPVIAKAIGQSLSRVPAYEGLPAWVTPKLLAQAAHADARQDMLSKAFRPLMGFMEEADILTGAERGLWRAAGFETPA